LVAAALPVRAATSSRSRSPSPSTTTTTKSMRPTSQPVVIEQPTSGWKLHFPADWQRPTPYGDDDVHSAWDARGIGHRVPPGANPTVMQSPILVWWGDGIRAGQSLAEVAELTAGHYGHPKGITLGEVSDVEVAGRPSKRVEVTFHRVVAFAPPGKGRGSMRAVLYLIQDGGQENGLWFEAPAEDFEREVKALEPVLRDAQIIPRKPPAQN
jgi:hypothetical protein